MSSRKDDPVFNVKFVQLVESKPCLWNSTLPEYSKKDEIQKAWQEVANETKDTVRNCRERWRTIRSSFLRSLKLSRTSTGRGKRKYYLSKYLQFLIPYTKTRLKNSSTIIAQRKAAAAGNIPPMTRISNMPTVSSDDTKDSSNSAEVAAIAEGDVVVSLHEGGITSSVSMAAQHTPFPLPQPLNLQTIKEEKDLTTSVGSVNTAVTSIGNLLQSLDQHRQLLANTNNVCISSSNNNNNNSGSNHNNTTNSIIHHTVNNLSNMAKLTNPTALLHNATKANNCSTTVNISALKTSSNNNSINGNNNNNNNSNNNMLNTHSPLGGGGLSTFGHNSSTESRSASAVDLTEFAEWIKSKNEHQRHCLMTTSPDADQSFLNSLHPYLREMSGKQNRRFRQKVVALIDAVLDNVD